MSNLKTTVTKTVLLSILFTVLLFNIVVVNATSIETQPPSSMNAGDGGTVIFLWEADYTDALDDFSGSMSIPAGYTYVSTTATLNGAPLVPPLTVDTSTPPAIQWDGTDIGVGTFVLQYTFTAPAVGAPVADFNPIMAFGSAIADHHCDVTVVSGVGPGISATVAPTEAAIAPFGALFGLNAYMVEIENTGSTTQTFSWSLDVSSQYSPTSGTSNSLAPGDTQTIAISFISDGTEGNFPATFTISANNLVASDTATMMTHVQNYGVSASVVPTEQDNPNHGTSSYTITVQNTGANADTYDWGIVGAGYTIGGATSGTTASIASGATLDLTLVYTPSGTGDFAGTVTFTSTNDGSKTDNVAVTTHVKEYDVDLKPDLGLTDRVLVGNTITHTITIENTGTDADTFSLTYTGTGTPTWSTQSVPLASGASTTFDIEFTEAAGTYSGTVTATSDTDPTKDDDITITSEFQNVVIDLDPPASVETGGKDTDIDHEFTITNDGNFEDSFTISVEAGAGSVSPLTVPNLASGASTTITYTEPQDGTERDNVMATIRATSVADPTVWVESTADSSFKNYQPQVDVIGVDEKDVLDGGATTYTFRITNIGGLDDSFTWTLTGNGYSTVATSPTATLAPGANEEFTVTFNDPESGQPTIRDYLGTVEATSTHAAVSDNAVATTHVVSYQPDIQTPGTVEWYIPLTGTVNVALDIQNDGDRNDVINWDSDLGTPTTGSTISLAPGATATANFDFVGATLGLGTHVSTFEATSTGDPTKTDTLDFTIHVVEYDVTLAATPAAKTMSIRDAPITYTVTITNTGDGPDTYDLAVAGAGYALVGGATIGPIAVGDSDTFDVQYTHQSEGTHVGTVTATSQADGTVDDDLTLTTTEWDYQLTVTPPTQAGSIRTTLTKSYTITWNNPSGVSETITLVKTAGEGTLSTTTLTIPAGGSQAMTLNYPALAALAPGAFYTTTIQGTVDEDGTVVPVVATVEHTVKSYGVTVVKTGTTKTLSEVVKVAAGTQVHSFTVTNTGNAEDTFTVTTTGSGTIVTVPSPLTIAAGGTGVFTVTHDTTTAGIDIDPITITSTGYTGAKATATAKTFSVDGATAYYESLAFAGGTVDGTSKVPFKLDLVLTGPVDVKFYKLPSNPRPSISSPKSKTIVYGTFTVNDKTRVTTATGTVYYTDSQLSAVTAKESSLTVYYWNEVSWVKATNSVLDTVNKKVTFTIEGAHWLDRSYDYDFVLAADLKASDGVYVPPPTTVVEPPTQDEFDDLDPEDAAAAVENLDDEDAAKLIEGTTTEKAAETIEQVSTTKAATILSKTETSKAAQILEKTTTTKAAAIIEKTETTKAAEIIEQTQTEKAAGIIDASTTQKATEILTTTTTTKAAQVMEKLENTKVNEIIEEAVTTAATDKVAKVLVETQKEKVADMLLEVKTDSAAKVIKEMGNANLNSAAERVEEAVKKQINELDSETKKQYKEKIKATMENPELSVDDLVNLFVEIANLPNTPSTVAEIFEIIEVSKTVEVVDGMIAKDKLSEVGLVFSYLTPEKLVEIYTAMTSAAREAVYPYFDAETMGNLPEMTTFSVSADVSDTTVTSGTPVTVTADVENTGDDVGSIEVTLRVNGVVTETETVVLGAGETTSVTWTVTKTAPGTYSVDINGETATFTVEAAPEPAAFETSGLTVTPASVQAGEDVTVTVTVENTGEESGSYTVEVELDGTMVDSESVTLDGGASTTVSFTVSSETEGSHTVSVDTLSESFTVEAPPAGFPWTTAIIVIILVAAVAGYLYMQQQKKEE